jgi:hypothetical protein
MAQGDDLAKYTDAGMDSDAEDGMSTVSETSEGSGGTSRRSSRSARTSRTARSARETTPVDDLLVELASRSYKDACRIARETDTVEDINERAWALYITWVNSQPEGSKATVSDALEALEQYDWVTHSRVSQGGLTDVRKFDFYPGQSVWQ